MAIESAHLPLADCEKVSETKQNVDDPRALESQNVQASYTDVPGQPAWTAWRGVCTQQSTKARLLRALGAGLGVYLLLHAFNFAVLTLAVDGGPHLSLPELQGAARPRPADGKVHSCLGAASAWEHVPRMPGFPANAHATFRVPLDDAEALYVFSRGKNQDGWLRIVHEDRLVDGYAEVVVEASYEHEGVLDSSSVCYLEREAGERGVGLMTPDGWSSEPHGTVWFQVKVALPAGVEVRRLEAHMSNYAITVEDTRDTIVFDDVDLKTSNFGIDVKSLNASRASLRSSNGPIKGRFAARQLLDLHTSNAEINVLVDLFNEDGESATEYRARTINGYLHSFINLARFADAPSSGGSYSIDTRTSNGGLALNFGSSPVDSHLDVVAWTSNAPASVVLHPAFEGRYHADTSNAGATLMRTNTKDPSGKGRERVIREDVGLRQTEVGGVVFWDDEDSSDKADKGSVRVSSSNKLVTLVI